MADPASSSQPTTVTAPGTSPEDKPRRWGWFEYEQDSRKNIIEFVKEGNDGEQGVGGYVFGRRQDCDFVLPYSTLVSGRHFLVYKEMVDDKEKGKAVERVFLKDFSSNGTFINGRKVGVNRRKELRDHDKINYLYDTEQSKERCRFIFREAEPIDTLSFDGHYERGPQLGSGNFATVFRATNKKSGVVYAVKVVKKNESFNAKVEHSLEREIGILMSINQENLLRIHQVFNEERFYYVVTELARDGELFDQIIDKQKFTENEARHIFRQVFQGVKYLHDRGIVHRDLKPENILVMDKETMTVKISDFGLAKMIGEQVLMNTICGTPSYVAPEVIRDGKYGKSVDMWSLGVVLYICLCGFPPFSDDLAPPKLRVQVLQSMYTFPSPYWDEVSDEAVDLIQGLLAQNTDDRLSVDEALDHVWMHLEDDAGTMPTQERHEFRPQVGQLLSRVMTERADRAVLRGVRIGFSQPTAFSQTIPDLPEEEEEEEEQAYSPEVSQQAVRGDTVDMGYGSGIGIFSQDGMVRGAGMDTDSECEGEGQSEGKGEAEGQGEGEDQDDDGYYQSPRIEEELDGATGDSVAGNDSDRSYMSVLETFNNGTSKATGDIFESDKSMREPSMNGESMDNATATTPLTRDGRSESGSDSEERSTKRARIHQ
ncbi:kinase-like domain-containing protein [Mortierella sp. GBAus27b]|nr:kinase-like domain-containing protein [Mortierella sp. GBAus27b]